MPITQPLVLANNASGGSQTFNKMKPVAGGSQYLASGSTASEPATLSIRTQEETAAKTGDITDVRTVQMKVTLLNANGIAKTMVVTTTVRVPRDPVFTATVIEDTVGYNGNLLDSDTERNALLLGFT